MAFDHSSSCSSNSLRLKDQESKVMNSSSLSGLLEEFLIVSGLISVQVVSAVFMVFLNRVLLLGVDPLFLVIFANFATVLFLLPAAALLERDKWRTRLRPVLMVQLLLIAALGVTGYQALILLGNKKTSPAIASALPNLAPGAIFAIAACVRFEKFSIWCKYSRAKILGTIVCLSGAIAMSFLMSPSSEPSRAGILNKPLEATISGDWILGCFYLLTAVVFLSCTMVLQAAAMFNFPAPISICLITCLMGSILTAMLQYIMEGKLDAGSSSFSLAYITCIVLLGGAVNSVCSAYLTFCVNKKGPVMVSIFSPIQTVSSVLLSAVVLGQVINTGSIAGMLLMFVGLYIVLWAKKKEDCEAKNPDIEKPLLT